MWYHGVLCCDWLHCMLVGGMMPCLYLEGRCAAAGPGVVAAAGLLLHLLAYLMLHPP